MSIVDAHIKILDEEMCFTLWAELGSLPKVSEHISRGGYVNPNTGKPFSITAIHQASLRYMLDYPEKTRKVFLEHGDERTQEEWEESLVRKACQIYGVNSSRQRFYRWLRKNGFKEKYKYIWSARVYLDDIDNAEQERKQYRSQSQESV